MIGTLYGVGVGPGDPELITVKAYRVLKEAHTIAYPKKRKGSKSYAHQIIDVYVNPNEKDMLGLVFPMTKDEDVLTREWTKTAHLLWEKLKEGKDVAFVTEGDPSFYSTFIHVLNIMKELYPNVKMDMVPGISSINGASARLGIPLAEGDEHIAIIPAREDQEAMKKALLENDCIIFLKIAKVLDFMLDLLEELDLLHKAHVVTKVTSKEEIIWDVKELKGTELGYLSLMVVRK
ncbi:precorrin-2 C(20)-methyltransferase [Bacillus sp. FJAT-47783]|uniref:precorrin-2 C(20)-methyltransferase n=1 Tax=Bacillus sp. FJAT-47783 TaxID=2922712 RepID=UPI001FACAB81|nr:precorrin-2 C(20)-methyltransferase [Bacillus sp. FJAT-47783]